jgi:hypothetical protein
MSWQNFGDDPDDGDEEDREPVLTTGEERMDDGAHFVADVRAEPEVTDTDYGDALRVELEHVEATDGVDTTTESGRPFGEGEPYVLLTWSKRLGRALQRVAAEHDPDDPHLAGARIRITKHVGEGRYSTDYSAELVGDGEAEADD